MSIVVQHRRDTTANVEANTPAAGELWADTTKGELSLGNGALAGGIRLQKKNSSELLLPAQITANSNDYNPAGLKHAGAMVITTDASRDITGMVAVGVTDTVDGREITIYNGGSFNAVLRDQNAASTAANRFDLGGADITLGPKASVTLRYRTQGSLNRWEVKASTAGATIADGGVIARKLAASAMPLVGMINGTLAPSVAGSALTIALKTLAGADPSIADPVYLIFRDATPATGDYVVRTIIAATSLVISSGSSMGVPGNNLPFRLWLTAHDNAGAVQLGAINCLNGSDIFPLAGFGIASTTAEGGAGAADNAQTFYTTSAIASKAYVPLGYMSWEAGLAASGTWSAAPTRMQLAGYGVPLPGQPVQKARVQSGSVATGTTATLGQTTPMTNTQGDQYLSKAITPSSAANVLRIRSEIHVYDSGGASGGLLVMGLFQDTTVNSLAATMGRSFSGYLGAMSLWHEFLAGTTLQTTFKIRAGTNASAATITFNGQSGAVLYGNLTSFIDIEEIQT